MTHDRRVRKPLGSILTVAGLLGWNVWTVSSFIESFYRPEQEVIWTAELSPRIWFLFVCLSASVSLALIVVMFWVPIDRWLFARARRRNARFLELRSTVGKILESLETRMAQPRLSTLGWRQFLDFLPANSIDA